MRRTIAVACLAAILASPGTCNASKAVSFFQEAVLEIDGRVIKLLGGSTWLMDSEIAALPLEDAIVVFDGHDPLSES
jgi:hypothetical protein